MVASWPGRLTIRPPVASSSRSADSSVTAGRRWVVSAARWASLTLRISSLDWRRAGARRSTRPPRVAASCRARTAETVDLPDWRAQLRRSWRRSVRRRSACQGSGSRPQARAKATGSRVVVGRLERGRQIDGLIGEDAEEGPNLGRRVALEPSGIVDSKRLGAKRGEDLVEEGDDALTYVAPLVWSNRGRTDAGLVAPGDDGGAADAEVAGDGAKRLAGEQGRDGRRADLVRVGDAIGHDPSPGEHGLAITRKTPAPGGVPVSRGLRCRG